MTWVNGTMSGHIRYTVVTYWPASHTDLFNDPPGTRTIRRKSVKINQGRVWNRSEESRDRRIAFLIIYF